MNADGFYASSATQPLWSGVGDDDWVGRPVMVNDGSKWIAIYRKGENHTLDPGAQFHIRFSTDEGATWTAEDVFTDSNPVTGFPLSSHAVDQGLTDAIIFQAPNGDLLINTAENINNGTAYTGYDGSYQYRSTDGGATWTAEGQIAGQTVLGGQDSVIVGTDIYCTMFVDPSADAQPPFGSALYKSSDNGGAWSKVSDINASGTDEAGIEHLGDGVMIAVLRDTSSAATYLRISQDYGATWGSLVDITDKIGVLQRPRMHIFADEPNRVYLFGRDEQGNDYTVMWYTDDQGATWLGQLYPDLTKYQDTGYCDILKRAGGTYYMLTYAGLRLGPAQINEFVIAKA